MSTLWSKNGCSSLMNDLLLKEKLNKGWLHAKMFFEVLAINEKVTEESLRNHLNHFNKMENIYIINEKLGETIKVDNPKRDIKVAYSKIAEIDVIVRSYEYLLYSIIFYGPSSVEIIEPKNFELNLTEAQNMINAVAEIMHKYADGGAGGIVISNVK